jgi:response regulator RpfG family c-di-GMP phosphodiesterase
MAHATKPERRLLVLVVDDEPLMLPLVARILRENGYEVQGATHGLAAKQILASGTLSELSPDVLRDRFLSKPFSSDALLALVRRCIGRSRH